MRRLKTVSTSACTPWLPADAHQSGKVRAIKHGRKQSCENCLPWKQNEMQIMGKYTLSVWLTIVQPSWTILFSEMKVSQSVHNCILWLVFNLLGWKDLNPRNNGVRVRCLTAWRHPNIFILFSHSAFILYHVLQAKSSVFIKFYFLI